MGARGEVCSLLWAEGNASLEHVTPGLNFEEVGLVEKGAAGASAGRPGEFAHTTARPPGGDAAWGTRSGRYRAGQGEAKGWVREQMGSLPALLDRPLQTPAPPTTVPRLFIVSLSFQAPSGF